MDGQNTHEFSVLFNNKIKKTFTDKKTRNKAIRLLLVNILLFVIVYYAISNYTKIKKLEAFQNNFIEHSDKIATQTNKTTSKTINENLYKTDIDKATNHLISNFINDTSDKLETPINTKNIYKTRSNNPRGFYVLVGSFQILTNAYKKQKKNPTSFSCYIFENSSNFNRVGLLVSQNDRKEAEKLLVKFKKMQPDSWLVYNESIK